MSEVGKFVLRIPANEYECPRCHRRNDPGEYFSLAMGAPYDLVHLCPTCLQAHELDLMKKRGLAVSQSPYADPIETQDTDEILCPHCGYRYSDSYEFDGDGGEIVCDHCDREFHYERATSVSYSTRRTGVYP